MVQGLARLVGHSPRVLGPRSIWLNPRLFAPPVNFDSWAARGVLGERVWIKKRAAIAPHRGPACPTLIILSGLGGLIWVFDIMRLDLWPTLTRMALTTFFKICFVDRTAWIWVDFQRSGGTVDDLKDQ